MFNACDPRWPISRVGAAGTVPLIASCGKEPVVSANSIRVDWGESAAPPGRERIGVGLDRGLAPPGYPPASLPGLEWFTLYATAH
jgi:hypothetical protein